MKVLHCLNHFLPTQPAGTEVYTWALCKALQAQGIEIAVAIPNYGEAVTDSYEYDGITVFKFAEPSIANKKLQMGLTIPGGVGFFGKLLEKFTPDVVHFHELAGSNGFTVHHVVAAYKLNIKTIMTFHLAGYSCKAGTLMYKGKTHCDGIIRNFRCSDCVLSTQYDKLTALTTATVGSVFYDLGIDLSGKETKVATGLSFPFIIHRLKKNLALLEQHSDMMVTIADWYQQILIRNGVARDKLRLVKQGLVPQNEAGKDSHPLAISNESAQLKLIFVGRISHFKGVHLILAAMTELQSYNIRLDIYGPLTEEDYASECMILINQLDNVRWLGKLDPGEVVEVIHQYDALILASTFSEMAPLVIQEAYEARRPVIASNVYGNAEQIEVEKSGWLFQYNDSDSLKKLLIKLAQNANCIVNKARATLPPVRKFDTLAKEYSNIYKEVLEKIR